MISGCDCGWELLWFPVESLSDEVMEGSPALNQREKLIC